jgi:hypothetical protein
LRNLDLSSWQAAVTTLLSLAVVTIIGVGIRLLTMVTIQQRREHLNRQINERLRTLIAAYSCWEGRSPASLPSILRIGAICVVSRHPTQRRASALDLSAADGSGSDRARRIRDAVEAALSDIILLGTEEQVSPAAHAARELNAGKLVHTHDLVVSLRTFIRDALDLDPVPSDGVIPAQGPTRPTGAGGRDESDKPNARQGGGGGGMGGRGMGGNPSVGTGTHHDDDDNAGAATHHR